MVQVSRERNETKKVRIVSGNPKSGLYQSVIEAAKFGAGEGEQRSTRFGSAIMNWSAARLCGTRLRALSLRRKC